MSKVLGLFFPLLFVAPYGIEAAAPGIDPDFAYRMKRLEAETQALRDELAYLRAQPLQLHETAVTPAGMSAPVASPQQDDVDLISWPELQTEMKKLAWGKGDFKIVPYGILWGNMAYETSRTFPTARSYVTWAQSLSTHGEDAFAIDGRTSRVGLNVSGPSLWPFGCAKSGGKVEFDFQGSFATTENKGSVLLRHAYWEIKNEDFRLLFGQTWDVISPLIPGTVLYTILWDAGNVGYRRAQLRGERYLGFSDTFLLTLQGSLNHNIVSDFRSESPVVDRPEDASWPLLQARIAATLGYRDKWGLPITFGVSGHIGEQGFDVLSGPMAGDDVRRRTWSLNADVKLPVNEWLGFQGELFTGENLGTFLGGIGQGIDSTTLQPIRSNGGWLELYAYWLADLHSHFGYSIDDPLDEDITNGRTYNQVYFGNLIWDVTGKFQLGFEVSSWRTLYTAPLRPGEAVRFEFAGKYGF